MKIYHNIEAFKKLLYAVVTAGTFDGVHKGHRKILKKVKDIANRENGESVAITYWPHPRTVLLPDAEIKLINTLDEKINLLEDFGIDHLLIIPFTKEFASITSADFVKNILIDRIGTKKLIIGYDHKFGKNREGGFDYLKENQQSLGFEVEEIPREDIDDNAVSSTLIRKALLEGDIQKASQFLENPYTLTGEVIHGDKIGREIGYPTANIKVNDPLKIIPGKGIYAVKVKIKEALFEGMMSIGIRPTVGGEKLTLEVNIFDFNKDIYGEKITVLFYKYLRPEVKFNNLEDLKKEIDMDKKKTLLFFSK
ncbi:MAG: bifunctional riboflavin kinase/FAD synthetase [Cytophagaceae bacterium]